MEILRARLADLEQFRERAVAAESALFETRRELAAVYANLQGVAYRTQPSSLETFDFVSPGIEALSGHSSSDFEQRRVSWANLIVPEDMATRANALLHAHTRQGAYDVTYRVRKPTGEVRHMHEQGRAVVNEEGLTVALEGMISDVTWRRQAEEALEHSKRQLELTERLSQVIVLQTSVEGELLQVPRQLGDRLGYSSAALHRLTYVDLVHPEDVEGELEQRSRMLREGNGSHESELRLVGADGGLFYVFSSTVLMSVAGSQVFVSYLRDITPRKQAEEALRQSTERYKLTATIANDGLWDWNLRTNQLECSARWMALLGLTDERPVQRAEDWMARIHADDLPRFRESVHQHIIGRTRALEVEVRIRHFGGSWRDMLVRGIALRDNVGRATRLAGSMSDVTDSRILQQKIQAEALYDTLTALPNRALLCDRIHQTLARTSMERGWTFAVLYINIDRFKVVNDIVGHHAGDQLLMDVADRLKQLLAPGDTLARPGADEFALLLNDIGGASEAARVASRVREVLRPPFEVEERQIFLTVSIGISLATSSLTPAEEVLRQAEMAMYRAKNAGRDRQSMFDEEQHRRTMQMLQIESELRRAIARQEFLLYYQPIVTLDDHPRLSGFEALVRWKHPERGLLQPADFIGVAEESGLIEQLGVWVLREACRQVSEWQARFPQHERLTLSVNMSPRQLLMPGLSDELAQLLEETGLPPESLGIEITESIFIEDDRLTRQLLEDLRRMRVRSMIDDFGTGYSSLGFLARHRVDYLKIDRMFVQNLGERGEHDEIVRMIASLAHSLGLKIVAEGIETTWQVDAVRSLNCHYAQGYLFSHPLSVPEAEELLGSQNGSLCGLS